MRAVKTIVKSFVNLLYPLHCLGCAEALEAMNEFHLCDDCIASIKYNAMPPFQLEPPKVLAYSACLYEGILKELIHRFKYKGGTVLSKIFSRIMTDYVNENPEIADADLITTVPLHKKRLEMRGFNQSLLLAAGMTKALNLPLTNTLKKIRKTKYQNELLKNERHINLKGAFAPLDKIHMAGKRVLLIDDVMTTGATLTECARALFEGGAKEVRCFTLARGF
jgi:competence protein ComFC